MSAPRRYTQSLRGLTAQVQALVRGSKAAGAFAHILHVLIDEARRMAEEQHDRQDAESWERLAHDLSAVWQEIEVAR